MPRISVIIPIYNSKKHLREAIDSVLAQTYEDWELLAINESGSEDGSAEIVNEYVHRDSRIQLIQNKIRLGLAESINEGIRLSKGEYIARLDADDLAHPERFQKQLQFMEDNQDVIVCGTYQHHFGPGISWIHKPATRPEQCKANLLFFCDLCHSTLMMRKKAIEHFDLWYDGNYMAEDFELWTRVVKYGRIANIPEILGEYRWGEDNITMEKKDRLNVESGQIVIKNLRENLHLDVSDSVSILFEGWESPYKDKATRNARLKYLKKLLIEIYEKNKDIKYYDNQALLSAIATKWNWARYYISFHNTYQETSLQHVFQNKNCLWALRERFKVFWINNKGINNKIRKIRIKIKMFIGS